MGQGSSMALEDVYLLYRLLQEDIDLQTVFQKFDDIRRPRLEEIWGLSRQGGDIRRETGPWKQWIREWLIWAWLKFMPERWMASPFEYDITTVQIMP
jgi:2-polyprenyl-6-methoxyphenol hydroxylase-like FAD-dependent oxidoreductase